jgi:DNA replication protein DnaC
MNLQNEVDAYRSMESQTWKAIEIEEKHKAGEKLMRDRRAYKERMQIMTYVFACGVIVGIIACVSVMK